MAGRTDCASAPRHTFAQPHEHLVQVARVVLDDQLVVASPDPWRKAVRPIADIVEMDAGSAEHRVSNGRKSRRKPRGSRGRLSWRAGFASCQAAIGGRPRPRCTPAVIGADDLKREIGFQLAHRHDGARLRLVIAFFRNIGEMSARQQMDAAHHRADQPFDMSAKARRPGGR